MLAKLHCIRFFVKTATRGVVLLLLWRLAMVLTEMLLENYSITTLLKPVYITNTVASNFTYYFVITVSYGLYLVAGFLSDAYWGSYNALVGSLWMLWLGAVWGSGGLTGAVYLESRGLKLAVRCSTSITFILAVALFESNVLQFTLVQLIGASSDDIGMLIYIYQWLRYVGLAVGNHFDVYTESWVKNTHMHKYHKVLPWYLLTVLFSFIVFVEAYVSHWVTETAPRQNWCRLLRLIKHWLRCRHLDSQALLRSLNSAYTHSNKAFTQTELEDAITFARILVVLASLIPLATTFLTLYSTYYYLLYQYGLAHCLFTRVYNVFGNTLPGVVAIPLYKLLIQPLVGTYLTKHMPRALTRIAIGAGLYLCAIGVTCLVSLVPNASVTCMFSNYTNSSDGYSNAHTVAHSTGIQLGFFATLLLSGVADVVFWTSLFHLLLAQSPLALRGTVIGMAYFLLVGVPMLASSLLLSVFQAWPFPWCSPTYYLSSLAVGALGMGLYYCAAKNYKYRKRMDIREVHSFT